MVPDRCPKPGSGRGNVHLRILALVRLGNFYGKGLGVQRGASKALAWYRVAAKDKNLEAMVAV